MLFNFGAFTLHSGHTSHFKIDCDALTDQDLQSLADLISTKIQFKQAIGVPSGGLRFATALNKYADPNQTLTLIVDDVLTTGKSMQEYAEKYQDQPIKGLVIFARNTCPEWITPIFSMNKGLI